MFLRQPHKPVPLDQGTCTPCSALWPESHRKRPPSLPITLAKLISPSCSKRKSSTGSNLSSTQTGFTPIPASHTTPAQSQREARPEDSIEGRRVSDTVAPGCCLDLTLWMSLFRSCPLLWPTSGDTPQETVTRSYQAFRYHSWLPP